MRSPRWLHVHEEYRTERGRPRGDRRKQSKSYGCFDRVRKVEEGGEVGKEARGRRYSHVDPGWLPPRRSSQPVNAALNERSITRIFS